MSRGLSAVWHLAERLSVFHALRFTLSFISVAKASSSGGPEREGESSHPLQEVTTHTDKLTDVNVERRNNLQSGNVDQIRATRSKNWDISVCFDLSLTPECSYESEKIIISENFIKSMRQKHLQHHESYLWLQFVWLMIDEENNMSPYLLTRFPVNNLLFFILQQHI